jgi:two-component system, NarL family, capsular synthesis sensor histidine kinase RcsC
MKNILLVDDNTCILDALALYFAMTARDCAILKARNGKEAAGILQTVAVDLILTDLNMPVMDGYELIALKNRFFPRVPLFAMTGDSSPEVMEQLNALGVTECLEKPFNFDAVIRMILKKLNEPLHTPVAQPAAHLMSA